MLSSRFSQWCMTLLLVLLAGAPRMPLSTFNDQVLMSLIHTNACLAVFLGVFLVLLSTSLMWYVMANVLDPRRFHHSLAPGDAQRSSNLKFGEDKPQTAQVPLLMNDSIRGA